MTASRQIFATAMLLAMCAASVCAQVSPAPAPTPCRQCFGYLYQLYRAEPAIRDALLVGPLATLDPLKHLTDPEIDKLLEIAQSGPHGVRTAALALLRAGLKDALEPPRSDRLLAIITDPAQPYDVVTHADDTFYRIVRPATLAASARQLRPAFDRAMSEKKYDYVTAYATAISRTGSNDRALSGDLERALITLATAGPVSAIEQTTYAYSAVASVDPPNAATPATMWLTQNIIANPKIPRDSRAAVAVGLLQRPALATADLLALRRALEAPANADLGTPNDDTTAELLAGLARGGTQYYLGTAAALTILSNFIESPNATVDQKSSAVENMRDLVTDLTARAKSDSAAKATIPAGELARGVTAAERANRFLRSHDTQFAAVKPIDDSALIAFVPRRLGAADVWSYIVSHAVPSSIAAIIVLYVAVFLLAPLQLLRWDAFLSNLAGEHGPPFATAILSTLGFLITFNRAAYVQDAWVRRNAKRARAALGQHFTSANVYVPLPIEVQALSTDVAKVFPNASAETIRPFLDARSDRMLISGEGGIGKTMLAFYLATLAIHENARARLWSHQSIPLVIAADFDGKGIATSADFLRLLAGAIAAFSDAATPVTTALVSAMLASKRIVLVVDGLSEMPDIGLNVISQALLSLEINAVIATTRSEAIDGGLPAIKIRPQRVKTADLDAFLRPYIQRSGYASLFTDDRIEQIRKTFSATMSDSIIPLFITMYIEMAVTHPVAGGPSIANEVPSIPRMILTYVRYLNDKIASAPLSTEEVIAAAKRLANLLVVQTHAYRPGTVRIDEVQDIFGAAQLQARLAYFESRLHLIQRPDQLRADLRFSIDTVCEYLAALYVLDSCQKDTSGLAPLHDKVGHDTAAALLSFLQHLEDCVNSDAYQGAARAEVLEELKVLREECAV